MDIDADGHPDILSGSYSHKEKPMAGLFQVLRGTAEGGFEPAKALQGTDGKPLTIEVPEGDRITEAICTRPTAVDWDKDGDLDLVVGNFAGSFYLFKGEGGGKFSPEPEKMKTASGELLALPDDRHSDPFAIDWDADGDLDLVSGSSTGKIFWSETGDEGSAPFELLLEYAPPFPENALDTSRRYATRIWADDLNDDGKPDLLIGDTVSLSVKDSRTTERTGTVWMYLQK